MYASEARYLEYLRQALQVLVKPLSDAARGIKLTGGDPPPAHDLFQTDTHLLSQLTEGRNHTLRRKQHANALRTADMWVFLKIYPQLEILTGHVTAELEKGLRRALIPPGEGANPTAVQIQIQIENQEPRSRQSEAEGGPVLCVGGIFLGLKALMSTYNAYAAVWEEVTSVLGRKEFAEFKEAVSGRLLPLTLSQHLHAPFDAMHRYSVQLQALLDETPRQHPDYESISSAVTLVEATLARMQQTQEDTRMYHQIQRIKASVLAMKGGDDRGQEIWANLISSERKLLKTGKLYKACRHHNKEFQFWLFDNCLAYAVPLGQGGRGEGRYRLNRVLLLRHCQARASREDPRALDILSPTKSFALHCPSVSEAQGWLLAARTAIHIAQQAFPPPTPTTDHTTRRPCGNRQRRLFPASFVSKPLAPPAFWALGNATVEAAGGWCALPVPGIICGCPACTRRRNNGSVSVAFNGMGRTRPVKKTFLGGSTRGGSCLGE
ncbi:pleckstrin domain-containing protein [Nannochloropsis gaditana]|uniref:Pleckstrin domain-containing protein n=1 Tax=Nannochloropsis gaditana TaxID=72520 RepID=W7TTR2_9STRA|nr:pleckstrin domain-containing protein [Nannochloropsis gaditana]